MNRLHMRLLIGIILLSWFSLAEAQQISVKTFRKLENDLSARTENRLDQNGDVCALIKVCADMDGVPLRKNNLTGPIALVLGSEGSGVSQLVKKLCDGVVSLDMTAQGTGVDSFNVSVAAGIILYEIQSQRAAE